MTKSFLVVFEAGPTNFSAFAPDIPGCYALGDSVDIARQRFLEAATEHLQWLAADHDPLPAPVTTSFDFSREDEGERGFFVVEWLPVPMPTLVNSSLTAA